MLFSCWVRAPSPPLACNLVLCLLLACPSLNIFKAIKCVEVPVVNNISFQVSNVPFPHLWTLFRTHRPKFTFLLFLSAEDPWKGGRFTCPECSLCADGFTCLFSFNSPSLRPACACKGTGQR